MEERNGKSNLFVEIDFLSFFTLNFKYFVFCSKSLYITFCCVGSIFSRLATSRSSSNNLNHHKKTKSCDV